MDFNRKSCPLAHLFNFGVIPPHLTNSGSDCVDRYTLSLIIALATIADSIDRNIGHCYL